MIQVHLNAIVNTADGLMVYCTDRVLNGMGFSGGGCFSEFQFIPQGSFYNAAIIELKFSHSSSDLRLTFVQCPIQFATD